MRWSVLPLVVVVLVGAACESAPLVSSPISSGHQAVVPPEPSRLAAAPSPTCAGRAAGARIRPLSPTGIGGAIVLVEMAGRKLAYIADEDERAVRTVDFTTSTELAVTPLDAAPGQLLVTGAGLLVVALRTASAVVVLEPPEDPTAALDRRCTVAAPVEPTGLALTPDGAHLLVTSRWGHALTAYETGTLKVAFSVDLPADPAAVVTSSDGARAFISHVTGARLSVVDLQRHSARQIDLHQTQGSASGGKSPVRWSTGQGYTLVRSKRGRIFAPEILANPDPTRGQVFSHHRGPGVSQIGEIAALDEAGKHLTTTPVVDSGDLYECLLPRAAAMDETSGRLLVTCLGRESSVIACDAAARNPHLARMGRWVVAPGPTGIAVDTAANIAVVWSQFAHAVTRISLDPAEVSDERKFSVARHFGKMVAIAHEEDSRVLPSHSAPMDAILARGRELFHAAGHAQLSGEGRACASCHADGRADGLTWATSDGPRQTPILASRLGDIAPHGRSGTSSSITPRLHSTFERWDRGDLDPQIVSALQVYVEHLDVPFRRGAPGPEALRGDAIFHSAEAGCATCHVDAVTFDGKSQDVPGPIKGDRAAERDPPSLRFLGQSAPYFHDGRYATLADLLRGGHGTKGRTAHLDDSERRALEAYLEAL